ncbi:MAG: acyl-CoA thioesterase [Gammaproteobacteria bacterium]|nr:acyl-CoA thioesterase [Gammaproteobacteria bacterium]
MPDSIAPNLPYCYSRRVQWGDADPALMAYTVRFLDFAMDAVDSWFRDVVGFDWYRMNTEHGMAAPAVHVSMDFREPLRPGDLLTLAVYVDHIGRSSLGLRFEGWLEGGTPVYAGKLVHTFVDRQSMRSTPIPALFREPIERYAEACDARIEK